MKIAFLADEITTFKKDHDSTWALMKACHRKNLQVFYASSSSLTCKDACVKAQFIELDKEFFDFQENNNASLIKFPVIPLDENPNPQKYPCTEIELDDFKIVFMRKDPPVDSTYIYETQLLNLCKKALVVNNPASLLINNEKLSILNFPSVIPETIVSESVLEVKEFVSKHKKVVLKPLDAMGGAGVFVLEDGDKNVNSIVETSLKDKPVMLQKFIPEIAQGDKRLIILNGDCIGALLRVPSDADNRANLAAGGSSKQYSPSKRDLEIVATIKDFLVANKIYFAGVDIIGDYLTEINITSPTCLQEINRVNELAAGQCLEDLILADLLSL